MKTISLECKACHTRFDKALKEYTRQTNRNPDRTFVCSLRCHGHLTHHHLKGLSAFETGSENHQKAVEAARLTNTKYIGDDWYFKEHLRRARNRKQECDLTIEYLKKVWALQDGRCAISHIPLNHTATSKIFMPSLDRKDSSNGYLVGNVQFVSCCINYAKHDMTDEQAHALMKVICENYLTQRPASSK